MVCSNSKNYINSNLNGEKCENRTPEEDAGTSARPAIRWQRCAARGMDRDGWSPLDVAFRFRRDAGLIPANSLAGYGQYLLLSLHAIPIYPILSMHPCLIFATRSRIDSSGSIRLDLETQGSGLWQESAM